MCLSKFLIAMKRGAIQSAIDEAMTNDPVMTRCLNFKYNCDVALQVYEELYKDFLRNRKQSVITNFFKK